MKTPIIALDLCLLALLALSPKIKAHVLDDFNDNNKTGWVDFTFVPGFGLPVEQDGQYQFSLPPACQPLFVASTKTSETYTLADGKTIEFRVDLISGNGPDSFAILSFVPKNQEVSSLAGYGFAKSSTDILVTKGIGKYFYNQDPTPALKNDNVTMVLSLTGQGQNVIINAKLLDKDAGDAVIFEKTFIDTPSADLLEDGDDDPSAPYMGEGNFALICYEDFDEDAPQESYDVVLDNAETYNLENSVLDDFNDNQKTDWEDFTFVPGFGLPVEGGGQFTFDLPNAGQPLFVASTKTSRTFDLTEGNRIEFSVDLISGNGKDSFALLGFIPTTEQASSLSGYGFAKSTTDILITKGIGKYFYNEDPTPQIKNDNVTLKLSLTAKDGNVIINGKVLDKDDNNAVIFEKTVVDTSAADILADGMDGPAAPYLGSGHFVLIVYEDFDPDVPQDVYEVVFDNATVAAAPLPANTAPILSDILPAASSSFLASSTPISFKVTDDKALTNDKIAITLGSQIFTEANGLNIAGTGNSRTVSLGGLSSERNYSATLSATDSDNATSSTTIYFDTFTNGDRIIEAEDYNFNSGGFIDDPSPISENSGPQPNAYANQSGTPDIDYSDTRTDLDNVPYRPADHVRMQHTLDVARQKFIAAGGSDALVFDYDVGDVAAGEWLDYTRTFATGTYEVYLREALVNGTQIETALEEVTGDRSQPDQTTRPLGSFRTTTTGFQYRNIPLTDALGQKALVRLFFTGIPSVGEATFRLRQVSPEPSDGSIFQNYLIFLPVADAPVQRATVASLSPQDGAVVETFSPIISATIQNRDTSVDVNSIKLFVNDMAVDAAITPTAEGATLLYSVFPLPPPNSSLQGRIEFKDSEGVAITSPWTFTVTYKSLDPANRASGAGQTPGLNLRFVQAPIGSQLEDSVLRAEDQLTPNSTIPKAIDASTTVQVVNFNRFEQDAGHFPGDLAVPGIDPDNNGTDDFAVEMTAWLDLKAGIYRFGMKTDDGYKLSSGAKIDDRSAPPLAFRTGGTADDTVEFLVLQPGLYPFRLLWYQRGGPAEAEWYSINRDTGERILINDPDSSDAIKAYSSLEAPILQVQSAAVVTGPYAPNASASIDSTTGTITIPFTAGGNQFFRLAAGAALKITSASIAGNNLILKYASAP